MLLWLLRGVDGILLHYYPTTLRTDLLSSLRKIQTQVLHVSFMQNFPF